MNDKVKELVERVRLTQEDIGLVGCEYQKDILETGEIGNFGKAIAEAQLNKVLNDDALALIDREWAGFTDNYGKEWHPVISLTEELKELR